MRYISIPNLIIGFLRFFGIFLSIRTCSCETDSYVFQSRNESKPYIFRIVNGKDATLGQIPFQVSFKRRYKGNNYLTFCGGSILNARIVLSAAHCFEAVIGYGTHTNHIEQSIIMEFGYFYLPTRVVSLRYMYAHAGTLKTEDVPAERDSLENGQWRKLRAVHLHPDYFLPRFDIAVVNLRQPFTFDSAVTSIPYASVTIQYYKGDCLTSGYGSISPNYFEQVLAKTLQYTYVKTQNTSQIHSKYLVYLEDSDSITGRGDSGGPLVCYNTGDPKENSTGLLVGTLTGKLRTSSEFATIYSRVSKSKGFIDCVIANCVLTEDDYIVIAVLFVAITGVIIITSFVLK